MDCNGSTPSSPTMSQDLSDKHDKIHRFVRKTSDGAPIERTTKTGDTYIDRSKVIWEWQLFRRQFNWVAERTFPETSKEIVLYSLNAEALTKQIHEWEKANETRVATEGRNLPQQ